MKKLDCGCGSGPKRPAQGYDSYCDIIKPKPGVILPDPYFCCPMENMDCFKDGEFDYVRSHHSLEHVLDPDKACAELNRIGKAGIISFPPMAAEMLYGRKDHNWYITVDRGRLLFIEKWHKSLGIPRSVTRSELNVDFNWTGSFDWQTVRVSQEARCQAVR